MTGAFIQAMPSPEQTNPSESEETMRERRQMRRVDMVRDVLFVVYANVSGSLRRGTTTDMSAGGLRIETNYPEKPGTELHIEVQPRPDEKDAKVLFYRGRVMHVTRIANGVSAMGVRMLSKVDIGAVSRSSTAKSGEPASPSDNGKNGVSREGVTTTTEPQPSASRRTPRPIVLWWWMYGRRPRYAWGLVLLAGIAATWYLRSRDDHPSRSGATTILPRAEAAGRELLVTVEGYRDFGTDKVQPLSTSTELEPLEAIDEITSTFEPRVDGAAIDSFLSPGKREALTSGPNESLIETMAQAHQLLGAGSLSGARELLKTALLESGDTTDTWARAARESLAALNSSSLPSDIFPAHDAFELEPRPLDAIDETTGINLEVDIATRVLSVKAGERLVRSYPIGVGWNGSTPRGEFRIANKLLNPDWYNDGNVVPAGSPSNPLGTRWMGLGRDNRATRYGIHGTNDPSSIGGAVGKGCIRMRGQDAEELFRWCAVGTPVTIR